MEIEAKFKVADSTVVRQLRGLDRVQEYSLSAPTRLNMRDTFYDTRNGTLLAERNVLRVRQRSDGNVFLTLKTSTTRKGAIHSRPEIEVKIQRRGAPRTLRIEEMPLALGKVLAPLVGTDSLNPIFSISQTREVRKLRRGRRVIAEWSLDRVKFRGGTRKRAFYELEIELKNTGTEIELHRIAKSLANEFALEPQEESKFARALEFMRRG